MRPGRVLAATGGLVVAAVTAREAAAIARVARGVDAGGRADHAQAVGEGVGEPLRLVLLGDSAVDGYGLSVAESLPRQLAARLAVATGRRVRVRSLAVSGATTADVASFQLPLLRAAGQVDAVLVGVGVNDALRRTRTTALRGASAALARGLGEVAPTASVAVVVCHDLSAAPGLGPVVRRVLGARCRAVARRQRAVLTEAGIPVVPDGGPGSPAMYGEDGLHPGARGVVAIADAAVATLVDRPAAASAAEGALDPDG